MMVFCEVIWSSRYIIHAKKGLYSVVILDLNHCKYVNGKIAKLVYKANGELFTRKYY